MVLRLLALPPCLPTQALDTSGWQKINPPDTPQQNNGCDCGVFTITNAAYVGAYGMDISSWGGWGQEHMEFFRCRVLRQLFDQRVD